MTITLIIGAIVLLAAVSGGKKKEHTYNAHWGDSSEHLSHYNHGFAITGSKAITKKLSYENCAVFGPLGSGKSSVLIISSAFALAREMSSMVFNDVSGEVYERTSMYLSQKGYRILRLNFSDSTKSETYNPLLECKSISDIQKMATMILRNSLSSSKSDPFWEQSSIMLISLFARYLVFHTEPEFRTLQNVLRMIETFAVNGEAIDKMFVRSGDEELLASYKATIVVGDKTLQSIIVSTRVALSLFSDPEVCKTTATNSIDFNLLREQPVALYVCNPLTELMYYRPVAALFFQGLFNHILSRVPEENERSIFLLIDEFATMKFPAFTSTILSIRKYHAGLLLSMQDEIALIAQYGVADAHQIQTCCGTQVFLRGQPLDTCKRLSQILGRCTHVIDDKGTERVKELMTPDEIRMCEDAIIIISYKAPLKCRTVPHYKNIRVSRFTSLPAFQLDGKEVSDPPLIPLM